MTVGQRDVTQYGVLMLLLSPKTLVPVLTRTEYTAINTQVQDKLSCQILATFSQNGAVLEVVLMQLSPKGPGRHVTSEDSFALMSIRKNT